MENTSLWVFGYGSLCWNPGFSFKSSKVGHIKNYARRFWQGNTTHRGVPGKPGRVATLVPEDNSTTYGIAFEIEGETALKYLNSREVELGGYKTLFCQFIPREGPSFHVLLYIATPDSKDWSGPAPLPDIASEIIASSGPSGHNVEYLLRLAECMRDCIPEGYDEHLMLLEMHVRNIIKEKNMCLETLMGDAPQPRSRHPSTDEAVADAAAAAAEERRRACCRGTFQFSANVPAKKLRCLNL